MPPYTNPRGLDRLDHGTQDCAPHANAARRKSQKALASCLTAYVQLVIMNRLTNERRAAILRCLVEGNSIRATARITGAAKNTVSKLLRDVGAACSEYSDSVMRDLPCKRIQCDEIWSFCYAKQKNLPPELRGEYGYGDVWTWVAIDADTKLVPSWLVGLRDVEYAVAFMRDLAARLASRVQLTTDGHKPYLQAVPDGFGDDIDFATLRKLYGTGPGLTPAERKYSPAVCYSAVPTPRLGKPDPKHINTSYVERQNLTMRMGMRRFTRLTNAFSKKVENLEHAVALHFTHYNFCRIHQTLRVTPAMEAGVSDRLWTMEDLVGLLG